MKESADSLIVVRPITVDDIDDFRQLQIRCFPDITPWTEAELRRQLDVFPEGQIGVEMDGRLVAASSSIIVEGADYEDGHTFDDFCGPDMMEGHDPQGDTLYGLDIVVDPEFRGMRLSRRMYEARKKLLRERNLRRILIAGRIPNYYKHPDLSVGRYVEQVLTKRLEDPVLTAQIAQGFSVRRILKDYLPEDRESQGYAVLMEWLNPEYVPSHVERVRSARVAAAQYMMRPITSFDDFATQCRFFAETASEYRVDVLLYPELLTNQLLGLVPAERPGLVARRLDEFTERYVELFARLAIRYHLNIIAGSHLTVEDDTLYNIGYFFGRDGRFVKQRKIHVTPSESRWWGVTGGDRVEVIDTDIGKIAILICYDIEFPELARIARAKGAQILFVPYNTDVRSGHMRVRACAQARAIENHVYCVLSGAVGNLPFVEGADIHYAQSCVLTPSDIPFSRDSVGAQATPGVETMVVHEVDFDLLRRTLRHGAVRTWFDRKTDLYGVRYLEDGEEKWV